MLPESPIDVSVIIPTYNRLWSLPRAIGSCKAKHCTIEVIVIDDGSTDGTWEWLQSQKQINKYKQDNWGKCWAANKGVNLARGKYIRFLDSDDLLAPHAIDEQFELAEQQEADVTVSGYILIDENERIFRKQNWMHCDDFIAQQLGECDSSHYSAYLFNKEFINDVWHRPDFAYRDDRLFVIELSLKEPKVAIHDGCALLHRMHSKDRLQFTSGIKHILQNNQQLLIYKKTLKILETSNRLTDRRIQAAFKVLWPLAHWIAKYDITEANEVVKWMLSLDKGFQVPESGLLKILYDSLGFKRTEQLLRVRRMLR